MATTFAEIPGRVAELLGGRIVRWVPASRRIGDYDGRHRTLEIFDVPAGDQRGILRLLRPARPDLERIVGGPLVIIFHTPRETERLYPEVSAMRRYRELAARMLEWMRTPHPDQPAYDPDAIVSLTVEAA
jgi:hypothetical protein